MNWGDADFVLVIVGICTAGWLINNWIRARHGYALEDEWGGKTEPASKAVNERLAEENAQLRARLDALEGRAATLEALVTDTGYVTAAQIEALRDGRAKDAA